MPPAVGGVPERPRRMAKEARWLWDLIVPEMAAGGVFARIDTAALMACCDLWSLYRAALKAAGEFPTDKDARIAVTAYFAAWERAAASLGLNPVARQRIVAAKGESLPGVRARDRSAAEERFFGGQH